jgi:hypothetical protein
MVWQQVYNPLNSIALSTLFAALPIVVLLGTLAILRIKAHWAAVLGLIAALAVAILIFGMPAKMALLTAVLGAGFGILPIGWILLHVIFLYRLTKEKGEFEVLQNSLTGITQDFRLQLVLIAFAFGAFFEGAAGFGTPVAVTSAILIGLGFGPLKASGLSLIANTAPVAFGALGIPIITLSAVSGLPETDLSAMAGRQLPFFSMLVPVLQRALRQFATHLRGTDRNQPDAYVLGQQHRRCYGEDDRCPEYRGGEHRHAMVWSRGRHFAVCIFPQHCSGVVGGNPGLPAGVRESVHLDGSSLTTLRVLEPRPNSFCSRLQSFIKCWNSTPTLGDVIAKPQVVLWRFAWDRRAADSSDLPTESASPRGSYCFAT